MCEYLSKYSLTMSDISETENITSDVSQDHKTSSSVDSLLEDLFPDLVGVNPLRTTSTETFTEQQHISRAKKRSFIENETLTTIPSPKKINIEATNDNAEYYGLQCMQKVGNYPSSAISQVIVLDSNLEIDTNKSASTSKSYDLHCAEQFDDTPDISQEGTIENNLKFVMPKKLVVLSSYHNTSIYLWNNKRVDSVYEYAVYKINVDENGELKNAILKEIDNVIKIKGFEESNINLSSTYLNIRKYILYKISPYIDDITRATDITINPGLSAKDVRDNYISNKDFFDKLSEQCSKIAKVVGEIPHEEFIPLIQGRIFFDSHNFLTLKHKNRKRRISPTVKNSIIDAISNLSNKIICEIKNFSSIDILKSIFFKFHGAYVTKKFMRNIMDIYSNISRKMVEDKPLKKNFEDYSKLISNALIQLKDIAETSTLLHGGKLLLPNKITAELMVKHLSRDINKVCHNLYCKLYNMEIDSILKASSSKSDKCLSCWDQGTIAHEGVYKYTTSTINIDVGNFGDIANNYYSELINHFLNEIGEKTKVKMRPYHGMPIKELELAYTSNKEFFGKLRELVNAVNSRLEKHDDIVLYKFFEHNKKLRSDKQSTINDISRFLINNISSIPMKIWTALKELPRYKLLGDFFSLFQDIYIDNASLLKVKEAFDITQEKVMNDPLLCESVERICDNICRYVDRIDIKRNHMFDAIIRSHCVAKKLSVFRHIKGIAGDQILELRKSLNGSIMTIHSDTIVIADERCERAILEKLRAHLTTKSLRLYKDFCIEKSSVKTYKHIRDY